MCSVTKPYCSPHKKMPLCILCVQCWTSFFLPPMLVFCFVSQFRASAPSHTVHPETSSRSAASSNCPRIFSLLFHLSLPALPHLQTQKEISCTKDWLTSDGKGKTGLKQESYFSIWYTDLLTLMELKNKTKQMHSLYPKTYYSILNLST